MIRSRSRTRDGGSAPWYQNSSALISSQLPKYWADYSNDRYAVNGTPKTFSDVTTHTRASTGTYFNSSGTMLTAAINTRRIDVDGLLLEEASTNLITQSENVSAWGVNVSTVTANTDVAPSGATTADEVAMTANVFAGVYLFGIPITSTNTYCYSFFIKNKSGGTKIKFGSDDATAYGSGTAGLITFDTSTKTWSNIGSQIQRKGYTVRGNYIHVWATATATGTNANSSMLIYNGDGAVTSTVALWGMQTELGNSPTSYIPTSGSTASRSADVFSIDGSSPTTFASWYNGTSDTVVIDANIPYMVSGATIWEVASNDTANRVYSFVNSANIDMWARVAGTYDITGSYATPYKEGNSFRLGCAYGTAGRKTTINAGKILEDTGTAITNSAHQKLFMTLSGGTAVRQIYLKSIQVWPIYATSPELSRITSNYVNYLVDGDSYGEGYSGYGVSPSLISQYNYTVANTAVGGDTLATEAARVSANLLVGSKPLIFCDGHVNGHGTVPADIANYQTIYDEAGGNVVFISPIVFPSIVGGADETHTDSLTTSLISTFGAGKVVAATAVAEALAGTGRSAGGAYAALFQGDAIHPLEALANALTNAALAKF